MYSRVGTAEWNEQPGANVVREAYAILKKLFVMASDDQVDEGLAEMGNLAGKAPLEIIDYILKKKVVPRDTKFSNEAIKVVMGTSKLFDRIQTPVVRGVIADAALANNIKAILCGVGVPTERIDETLDNLLTAVKQSIKSVLSEAKMPDKESIIKKLFASVMQDATIKSIMK
jgi:hypothetical protein